MSIKTTYHSLGLEAGANSGRVNTAYCRMGLFGRAVELELKFYHLAKEGTVINFGLKSLSEQDSIRLPDCTGKFLTLRQGSGSSYRYVQQEIFIKPKYGTILGQSKFCDVEDVVAGRRVAQAFLDSCSSIFESCRADVRRYLGSDIEDACCDHINDVYGNATESNIRGFLSGLHWDLLFAGSQCHPETVQVLKTTFANNSPKQYSIERDLKSDIPPLSKSAVTIDFTFFANWRATNLLKMVCGEQAYAEFNLLGSIMCRTKGYQFRLEPQKWIQCWDARGKQAQLCIHSVNYSVNPIDEVTMAWLCISDDLEQFFKTANVFVRDSGFCLDVNKNESDMLRMQSDYGVLRPETEFLLAS